PSPTALYSLSLHDALPILAAVRSPIATDDIGFRLGPRLNAAGRLTTAEKSLRLLMTNDETEATTLAEFLDKQNRERQGVEKETRSEEHTSELQSRGHLVCR